MVRIVGRAALRHRPLPLAARGLPQVHRPAAEVRSGQRLREDAVHGRRAPRPARGCGSRRWTPTTDWSGVPPTMRCPRPPTTPSNASPPRSTTPSRASASRRPSPSARRYDSVWLPTVGALQERRLPPGRPGGEGGVLPLQPRHLHRGRAVRHPSAATPTPSPPCSRSTSSTSRRWPPRCPPPVGTGFLKAPATDWSAEADDTDGTGPGDREHLRTEGKYSDGVTKAEQVYHPGPPPAAALRRLHQRPADGRQRRAVRRRDGAARERGRRAGASRARRCRPRGRRRHRRAGARRGSSCRAADGSWRTLATDSLHVQRAARREAAGDRHADERDRRAAAGADPAALRRRRPERRRTSRNARPRRTTRSDEDDDSLVERLPGWVRLVAEVRRRAAAPPRRWSWPRSSASRRCVGGVGAAAASVSARFVGAWRELVDHARDLGQPVPLGPTVTRREQSGSIGSESAPALARRADSFVFGPAVPRPRRQRRTGRRSSPSAGPCRGRWGADAARSAADQPERRCARSRRRRSARDGTATRRRGALVLIGVFRTRPH